VIQKLVSVIMRTELHEHAYHATRLPRERERCLNVETVWMKSEVYKRRVDTWNELFARILYAAARIKKREDQLRRTTRDLQIRDVMCI
jgi:hypothetical protein